MLGSYALGAAYLGQGPGAEVEQVETGGGRRFSGYRTFLPRKLFGLDRAHVEDADRSVGLL